MKTSTSKAFNGKKPNSTETWSPPFSLHAAGRGAARERTYHNDVSVSEGPRRLLLKHTLSGKGVLRVGDKRFELCVGDIFVIERPGPYTYFFEGGAEPWRFEYVSMVFNQENGILPEALRLNPVCSIAGHDAFLDQLRNIIKLRICDDYQLELYHSSLAYELFLSYIAMRNGMSESIPHAIRELKKMISNHFAEDRSIGEYTKKIGYSQEAATRLFKTHYGTSPGQYALNLRLAKARELLMENTMSVKEVSYACGFNSQNYLSRAFKRKFNITPRRYRSNPDLFGQ